MDRNSISKAVLLCVIMFASTQIYFLQFDDTPVKSLKNDDDSQWVGLLPSAIMSLDSPNTTPPLSVEGQIMDDGREWVQYPDDTEDWWYREVEGKTWIKL